MHQQASTFKIMFLLLKTNYFENIGMFLYTVYISQVFYGYILFKFDPVNNRPWQKTEISHSHRNHILCMKWVGIVLIIIYRNICECFEGYSVNLWKFHDVSQSLKVCNISMTTKKVPWELCSVSDTHIHEKYCAKPRKWSKIHCSKRHLTVVFKETLERKRSIRINW